MDGKERISPGQTHHWSKSWWKEGDLPWKPNHVFLCSLNCIFSGNKEPSAPAVIPNTKKLSIYKLWKGRRVSMMTQDLGKSFLYFQTTKNPSKYPLKCMATGKASFQLTRTHPAGSKPFSCSFAWIILGGMRAESGWRLIPPHLPTAFTHLIVWKCSYIKLIARTIKQSPECWFLEWNGYSGSAINELLEHFPQDFFGQGYKICSLPKTQWLQLC